ncbi:MAG: GAF domain-containing protein [Rhodoglobus sp.]
MYRLVYAVMRPFARAWITSSAESWRALPVPVGLPLAHAAGSDSNRLMLIGNGIAVSYGVLSHDLGLAGHLARRLTAISGLGTTVHVRAHPDITAADALAICSTEEIALYDAVVVIMGGTNAVLLSAASAWTSEVRTLIETLERHAPQARVHFVGIPLSSSLVRMPRFLRFFIEDHTRRLNTITAKLCSEYASAVFIPFEPVTVRVVDEIGRQNYERWVDQIAERIADSLELQVQRGPLVADEEARLDALQRMHILDSPRDSDLDQMVLTTRRLFGAAGAGINLIDATRQWVMAASGVDQQTIPRSESICTTTISRPDIFIVEDTHLNPIYREMDWAHGDDPIRFYAGYPIEAPDGHRIGALCILDDKPRAFSSTDRALLRELALRVQALLWEKNPDRAGRFGAADS